MQTLRDAEEDGIGRLRLTRPDKLNAINLQMVEELLELSARLRTSGLRALIVSGEGSAFCSGLDLSDMRTVFSTLAEGGDGQSDPIEAGVMRIQGIATWLSEAPFPTVAAIRGVAVGGGFEIALACDLRVVGRGARLGLPEVSWGLVPDMGGSQRLSRLIGLGRAKEITLTGDLFGAEEAFSLGIANRIVDSDLVEAEAEQLVRRMATHSATALREAKRLINASVDVPLSEGLRMEAEAIRICGTSSEFARTMANADTARKRPASASAAPD